MEIILRVALGIVLAGAALAKLASPRASIASMASFGFEGGALRPIAWAGLIAVELALAVAVALGSDGAAYAAAALMLLFAALTAGAILRGRAGAPCACFGPRSTGLLARRAAQPGAGRRLRPDPSDRLDLAEYRRLARHRGGCGARRLRRPRDRACSRSRARSACSACSSVRREPSRSRAKVRTSGQWPSRSPPASRHRRQGSTIGSASPSSAPRAAISARRFRRRSRTSPTTRMSRWVSSTRSLMPPSGASSRSPAAPSRSRSTIAVPSSPRGRSTTSRSWRACWRPLRGGGRRESRKQAEIRRRGRCGRLPIGA